MENGELPTVLNDLINTIKNFLDNGATIKHDTSKDKEICSIASNLNYVIKTNEEIHGEIIKLCSESGNLVFDDIASAASKWSEGNHIVFFDNVNFYVVFKDTDSIDDVMNKMRDYFRKKDLSVGIYNVVKANGKHKFTIILSGDHTISQLHKFRSTLSHSNKVGGIYPKLLTMIGKETTIVFENLIASIGDHRYLHHNALDDLLPDYASFRKEPRIDGIKTQEIMYVPCYEDAIDSFGGTIKEGKLKWSEILMRSGLASNNNTTVNVLIDNSKTITNNITGDHNVIGDNNIVNMESKSPESIAVDFIKENSPVGKTIKKYHEEYVKSLKNSSQAIGKNTFGKIVRDKGYRSHNCGDALRWKI